MKHTVFPDNKIKYFDAYLHHYCKGIEPHRAAEYAQKGEQYLQIFSLHNIKDIKNSLSNSGENTSTIAGYIIWALIKKAYDSGKPFGKGMFNISYKDDVSTQHLYEFLAHKTYSRISSHYDKDVTEHKGIDIGTSTIPWPWQFKTIVFGLYETNDETPVLYLKPERFGFNFLQQPITAMRHLYCWGKFLLKPQLLPGTESFRETDENPKKHLGQRGKEIHIEVDSRYGLILKEEKLKKKQSHIKNLKN